MREISHACFAIATSVDRRATAASVRYASASQRAAGARRRREGRLAAVTMVTKLPEIFAQHFIIFVIGERYTRTLITPAMPRDKVRRRRYWCHEE